MDGLFVRGWNDDGHHALAVRCRNSRHQKSRHHFTAGRDDSRQKYAAYADGWYVG